MTAAEVKSVCVTFYDTFRQIIPSLNANRTLCGQTNSQSISSLTAETGQLADYFPTGQFAEIFGRKAAI